MTISETISETMMRLLMRLLLGIARSIARNSTRIYWDLSRIYENITRSHQGSLVTVVDRVLPIFRTFSGDTTTSMLLFEWLHVFFSDCVLRRNQIIKEVVLVEASSILPLPRRSEAC